MLEETNDANSMLARHALADSSYFAPLLHFRRSDGSTRYPMADNVSTSRRLVDASGTTMDVYSLDAFGRQMSASGSTPNPYRYGAAWGYLTDTPGSGLEQLGARYCWPELGRFIQQDPIGAGSQLRSSLAGSRTCRDERLAGHGNGERQQRLQPLRFTDPHCYAPFDCRCRAGEPSREDDYRSARTPRRAVS